MSEYERPDRLAARADRGGRAPADGRLHAPLRPPAAQPHPHADRGPAARSSRARGGRARDRAARPDRARLGAPRADPGPRGGPAELSRRSRKQPTETRATLDSTARAPRRCHGLGVPRPGGRERDRYLRRAARRSARARRSRSLPLHAADAPRGRRRGRRGSPRRWRRCVRRGWRTSSGAGRRPRPDRRDDGALGPDEVRRDRGLDAAHRLVALARARPAAPAREAHLGDRAPRGLAPAGVEVQWERPPEHEKLRRAVAAGGRADAQADPRPAAASPTADRSATARGARSRCPRAARRPSPASGRSGGRAPR